MSDGVVGSKDSMDQGVHKVYEYVKSLSISIHKEYAYNIQIQRCDYYTFLLYIV